jgi:hypothetical protein
MITYCSVCGEFTKEHWPWTCPYHAHSDVTTTGATTDAEAVVR